MPCWDLVGHVYEVAYMVLSYASTNANTSPPSHIHTHNPTAIPIHYQDNILPFIDKRELSHPSPTPNTSFEFSHVTKLQPNIYIDDFV